MALLHWNLVRMEQGHITYDDYVKITVVIEILMLFLLHLIFILALFFLLRVIMFSTERETLVILCDKYPILPVIVLAMFLFSIHSIPYGIRQFQDIIDWNRDKSNRAVMEKQIKGMQEHIEEIEHIHAGIRSMKHDMRNTIAIVARLAATESGDAKRRLQEYLVADVLLTMKKHELERSIEGASIDADGLQTAEKYYGAIDWMADEAIFILSIMMTNEDRR